MAKDDKDIMSALRRAIADRVGNERYSLWFGPRTRFAWDGTELSIYAPNPFFREWIRTVFACAIEEACQSVIGQVPPISFLCGPNDEVNGQELVDCDEITSGATKGNGNRRQVRTRNSSRGSSSTSVASEEVLPLFQFASCDQPAAKMPTNGSADSCSDPLLHSSVLHNAAGGMIHADRMATDTSSRATCSAVLPDGNEATYPAAENSQLRWGLGEISEGAGQINGGKGEPVSGNNSSTDVPRDSVPSPKIHSRPVLELNSFIVGDSNRLAFAAADAVVRVLGSYSPLVFHGPSGVGKTHLLEGIWRAVKQRYPRIPAIYLSAEQFTSAYVDALHRGGVPVFRQKYRGLQLFLLDDLHFFVGKRHTQIELLYTIDSLLKNGCQIVCAADRPPCEIRELSQELVSRLEGGVVCRIDPPDHDVRTQIVVRLISETKLSLTPDVQVWLVERFTKNVRQLIGAVKRLEAAARALRRPLDVPLAEEILGDMLGDASCQIHLPDIEREVCRAFGLPEGALQSGRKDREITYPRMLAMWLARKYTRANLTEIGRYFGKRSHATVISAQKKVESWVREGFRISSVKGDRSITETLKELERRLRAG